MPPIPISIHQDYRQVAPCPWRKWYSPSEGVYGFFHPAPEDAVFDPGAEIYYLGLPGDYSDINILEIRHAAERAYNESCKAPHDQQYPLNSVAEMIADAFNHKPNPLEFRLAAKLYFYFRRSIGT